MCIVSKMMLIFSKLPARFSYKPNEHVCIFSIELSESSSNLGRSKFLVLFGIFFTNRNLHQMVKINLSINYPLNEVDRWQGNAKQKICDWLEILLERSGGFIKIMPQIHPVPEYLEACNIVYLFKRTCVRGRNDEWCSETLSPYSVQHLLCRLQYRAACSTHSALLTRHIVQKLM